MNIKSFLAGLIIGFFLFACIWLVFLLPDSQKVDMKKELDRDLICLDNGTVIRGWIIKEGRNAVFIETDDSSITVHPNNCSLIIRDYKSKYIKQLV